MNRRATPIHRAVTLLNWLDRQRPWDFLFAIYILRWLVIGLFYLPHLVLAEAIGDATGFDGGWGKANVPPGILFLYVVILAPALETLIFCRLPYAIIRYFSRKPMALRPMLFLVISTLVMVLTHPLFAMIPTTITGVALAYTYAHFGIKGHGPAFLFTTLFHAMINIVGWTIMALS